MDLGTIERLVEKGTVNTPEAYAEKVRACIRSVPVFGRFYLHTYVCVCARPPLCGPRPINPPPRNTTPKPNH